MKTKVKKTNINTIICPNCDGTGIDEETGKKCLDCNGKGKVTALNPNKPIFSQIRRR